MEKKKRLKNLFFVATILFAVAIVYYLLCVNFPEFMLKCIFHELTGLKCPGCGITRMIVSFMKFDFIKGLKYNYFLGFTLPVIVFVVVYCCYLYVNDKKSSNLFTVFCWVYVILLIIWAVVRNLIGC